MEKTEKKRGSPNLEKRINERIEKALKEKNPIGIIEEELSKAYRSTSNNFISIRKEEYVNKFLDYFTEMENQGIENPKEKAAIKIVKEIYNAEGEKYELFSKN